ncbi:MAG: Ig-like domain-containing protein, partial [Thermoanaerobaculia bacterium]
MLKTIRTPLVSMLVLVLAPSPLLAAPQFGPITPPDGTVIAASEVTLAGTVQGATSLEVNYDNCVVALAGDSFSVTCPLQEGTTSFILIAGDDQGGETQQIHQIVRDTTAPLLTVSQPAPGAVLANPAVTVAGTVLEPHLAEVLVTSPAGGTQPAAVDGASFSLVVALAPGLQTLAVAASDTVGNASQTTVDVTYDPEPPTIAVTANGVALVSGTEFNQPVVVVVTAADNVGVATTEILVDDALFSSGDTVSGEGAHTLAVTVTDMAGNIGQLTANFDLDFQPPTILAVDPPDGSLVATAEVTLTGEVEGATAVTVDGAAVSFAGDSFNAGPYPLTEGVERTFPIVATDAAGNDTSRQHRVERDSIPPAITVEQPADGAEVATASVAVSGTAAEAHLVEVRVAGALASLTGNDFSVPAVALSEGVNAVDVVAVDAAGNSSQEQVTVVRDTLAPQIQVEAGGVPLLDGAAFAGAVTLTIQVTDTTAVITSATLEGAAFTSGSTVTGDGEYQLSVVATDALGHSASLDLSFDIDTAPPVILSVAPPEGELTSATEVVISGEVSAAAAVTVNGQPAVLTGIVFTADPLPLTTEGDNVFTVVATDLSGNSDQVVRRVVHDSIAPMLTIGQPPSGAVVKTTSVDVSGSVSDVHLASVRVNAMEATVTGTGFAAFLVPLNEGDNELEVIAEDEVGLSTTRTRSIVLDTEVPTLAITDPAPGTVVPDEEIVLRGTAADPHLDRVEVDGRPAQLDGDAWSITVELEPGTNDFIALAFDTLGHVSAPAALMVFRDSEAPSIQIEQPAEGLITQVSSVEVSGTVEDDPEIVLTVNGVEVPAAAGAFESTVDLVEEGENRIIARATDALGNQGTHTRLVMRDTTAPEWQSCEPADGALAVPASAVFRLTFSETLAAPVAGAWSLETAAGVDIAATAVVDGDELVITPSSPLPSLTGVRLVLTAALADPAGNALTAPPTLSFTTTDAVAPGAPILDPTPPLYQCVSEAALAGTTEPEAVVRVTGGAATVSTRADVDGAFALTVPLVPDLLNHLAVVAVDLDGNPSPATFADVVQDCEAPRVEDAERDGDVLTITFSETVESATVEPAVTVTDGGAAVTGNVAV